MGIAVKRRAFRALQCLGRSRERGKARELGEYWSQNVRVILREIKNIFRKY